MRAKRASDLELYRLAEVCARRVEGTGAALWIDDRPDVAALVGAFGVHVGQSDLPPLSARRVVGPEMRIGRSTHDALQFAEADADPEVDVIALGPIFATASKENPEAVVGLDQLAAWCARTTKPVVAIGGIDADRLAEVFAAGADSAAVLGAILPTSRATHGVSGAGRGKMCAPPGDAMEIRRRCERLLRVAEAC